jgi:hypothetical protein
MMNPGAALFDGGGRATTAKYAATFTIRASNDSRGTFTVSICPEKTLLRDIDRQAVEWNAGTPATVTVH